MSRAHLPQGCWRSNVAVRALRAWTRRQLASLECTLAGVLCGWRSDWGLAAAQYGATPCVLAEPVIAANAAQWLGGDRDAAAWVLPAGSEAHELAASLFDGTPQVTPLLEEIGAACWSDLIGRMRVALRLTGGEPQSPSASATAPWSGSLVVGLPHGSRLLLGGALVQSMVDAVPATPDACARGRMPRVPVERALAASGVELHVQLQGCELAVGSLRDLQIGDVVRLGHRLDAPAAVMLPDGTPLFSGFLARSRGRKTVELAAAVA